MCLKHVKTTREIFYFALKQTKIINQKLLTFFFLGGGGGGHGVVPQEACS
jgi:hypothetical protein